jgi:hypothetical protein
MHIKIKIKVDNIIEIKWMMGKKTLKLEELEPRLYNSKGKKYQLANHN